MNASSVAQTVEIKLVGATHVESKASVITLSGETTQETNSIAEPSRIVPVTTSITNAASTFNHRMPKYSVQVIEISLL